MFKSVPPPGPFAGFVVSALHTHVQFLISEPEIIVGSDLRVQILRQGILGSAKGFELLIQMIGTCAMANQIKMV